MLKEISVGFSTLDGHHIRFIPGLNASVDISDTYPCYGGFLCEEMGMSDFAHVFVFFCVDLG